MNDMEIAKLLHERRSGRAYDAVKTLSDGDMNALLEAARWAPSAFNVQPWRFLMVRRDDPAWEVMVGLLSEFNRVWARHASALLLTAVHTMRHTPDGRTAPNDSAIHDAGLVNMSLLIEAVHRGLMGHVMAGFDKDAARALISGAERALEPVTMMAIGYAGAVDHLPEPARQREAAPRTRLSVEELLIRLP